MDAMASQITSLTIVYSTVYSGADQRKQQSSASLAFVRGIHRWPVNSPHKWPVTRKCFYLMTVIMLCGLIRMNYSNSAGHLWKCCGHPTSSDQTQLQFQGFFLLWRSCEALVWIILLAFLFYILRFFVCYDLLLMPACLILWWNVLNKMCRECWELSVLLGSFVLKGPRGCAEFLGCHSMLP